MGPNQYREDDALGRSPQDWDEGILDAVHRGCEQIVAWRGITPEAPLEDVGVPGFYALLRLFHFTRTRQSARIRGGFALDEMVMAHEVTHAEIILYNKVALPDLELG